VIPLIRRLILVSSGALVFPALSVLLTTGDTNKALLASHREVIPGRDLHLNVSGTSGTLALRGTLIPEAGGRGPALGDLEISLSSSRKTSSVLMALDREKTIGITLPYVEKPQSIVLSYLPVSGSLADAALIASDLMISWDGEQGGSKGISSALRAWACPLAPWDVVGVVYFAALIAAFLAFIVDVTGLPVLAKVGPTRWGWLFVAAVLVSAFPGRFSPLTRLIAVGRMPLALTALMVVGLLAVRRTVLFPRQIKSTVVLVLFVAGLLRVVAAIDVGDRPPRDIDEIVYSGMAANIAMGKGLIIPDNAYKTENLESTDPVRKSWWENGLYLGVAKKGEQTAAVPPLYPVFLSAFFQSHKHHHQWIYQAQAILGTASCLMLYVIGSRMASPPAALAGLMLAAVHAPFVAASRHMFTETVFFFILLLSVFFLSRKSYGSLATAGALLAATALTRSVAVAVLPAWLLCAAMGRLGRERWIAPLIILVSFSCIAAPWVFRNRATVERPIFGSTFAGKDLFVGNNDTYRRDSSQPPSRDWESLAAAQRLLIRIVGAGRAQVENMFGFPVEIVNEVERGRELRLRALSFIISYPRTFLRLAGSRLEAMIGVSGDPRVWDKAGMLPILFLPMLPLIPFGLIWGTGGYRYRIFLLLSAILLAIPPLLTIGYPRYRLPSDWFLFLLAGAGVQYTIDFFSLLGAPRSGEMERNSTTPQTTG